MPMHNVVRRNSRLALHAGGLALAVYLATALHARPAKLLRPEPSSAETGRAEDIGGPRGALADRQIREAQRAIQQAPSDAKGYNALCAAYMRKARETGDFG